jgi:hypothetical protein
MSLEDEDEEEGAFDELLETVDCSVLDAKIRRLLGLHPDDRATDDQDRADDCRESPSPETPDDPFKWWRDDDEED